MAGSRVHEAGHPVVPGKDLLVEAVPPAAVGVGDGGELTVRSEEGWLPFAVQTDGAGVNPVPEGFQLADPLRVARSLRGVDPLLDVGLEVDPVCRHLVIWDGIVGSDPMGLVGRGRAVLEAVDGGVRGRLAGSPIQPGGRSPRRCEAVGFLAYRSAVVASVVVGRVSTARCGGSPRLSASFQASIWSSSHLAPW